MLCVNNVLDFFPCYLSGNNKSREERKTKIEKRKEQKKRRFSFENRRFFLANDSNFDRNPLRGCNYGLEGGAFLILEGCNHGL